MLGIKMADASLCEANNGVTTVIIHKALVVAARIKWGIYASVAHGVLL